MAGSDYEHWADEDKHFETAASAVAGYNTHNGLRQFTYQPTNQDVKKEEKKAATEPPKPEAMTYICNPTPPAPIQQAQPQQFYYMTGYHQGYPQMQYAYLPQMAYPAPAYYGYPQAALQPSSGHVYQPAPVEEKKEPKVAEPKKWQGRTKAEVEDDNMKIAKSEGAYDARNVEPKGMKEDQMVWCVEVDGSHTLRTYAGVKGFDGEWKADPRFQDSWYFVREEKKEKKK